MSNVQKYLFIKRGEIREWHAIVQSDLDNNLYVKTPGKLKASCPRTLQLRAVNHALTCNPNIFLECLFEKLHQGIKANVRLMQKGSHCSGIHKHEYSLPRCALSFCYTRRWQGFHWNSVYQGRCDPSATSPEYSMQVPTDSEITTSEEKTIKLIEPEKRKGWGRKNFRYHLKDFRAHQKVVLQNISLRKEKPFVISDWNRNSGSLEPFLTLTVTSHRTLDKFESASKFSQISL